MATRSAETTTEKTTPSLTDRGISRIEWALSEMPVLGRLLTEFSEARPLEGIRIGACLHVTTETANLVRVLTAGGAHVALCASNPLSTQDDVAAALNEHYGIATHARRGEDDAAYYAAIDRVLDTRPRITMDDGADLVTRMHRERPELLDEVLGSTEETTTGVIRLRAMSGAGELRVPVVAVNDAMTKHLFDNRYGTGQSTIDGIIRATNILLAGRVFTVAGYGWCGRGIAMRARGHGARVVVTEVSPLRALEALMDGFEIMPMTRAAALSDFIVTATGDKNVVAAEHLDVIKSGCVVANSGHFNVEIDLNALRGRAKSTRRPRENVEELTLDNGRVVRLLAEGRLVNLAAAEGHPAAVMDMSFANQALTAEYFAKHERLAAGVHGVPETVDERVARNKLTALGAEIDELSPLQREYLASWREGT